METLAQLWTLPDLGNLTATAVLGWYAWHTVSRTIPEVIDAFRLELAALRNEGRLDREAFFHELNQERQQRHADHVEMVEALHGLTIQQRDIPR